MSNNSKLLIIFSFLILLGTVFILVGLNQSYSFQSTQTSPIPTRVIIDATESAKLSEENLVLVTKVVDGDTVEIESGEKVRLIGVDTPETVDPKRPVGCFGKEASNETKSLLEGKKVVLERDAEDKDKYGRLLRYIYLPLENGQQLFVDDFLIREGFGKTLNIPPDSKYAERFTQAQDEARIKKKGLWGSC